MPVTAMPLNLSRDLVETVVTLARRAGDSIMGFYDRPIDVRAKQDHSPVTEADEAAEAIILPGLAALTPGLPIVSEEAVARDGGHPGLPNGPSSFWLVDPLDGTKEFIKRNGEFTVNIALIEEGAPALGVVHLPATGTSYTGWVGVGATKREDGGSVRDIVARIPPTEGLTVLASRSHADNEALERFLASWTVHERISAGSSLKFCRIAEGVADLYPRLGRTMEWDTAAGHAVLAAAGGGVRCLDGTPLRYGKPGFENPHFVAYGREA